MFMKNSPSKKTYGEIPSIDISDEPEVKTETARGMTLIGNIRLRTGEHAYSLPGAVNETEIKGMRGRNIKLVNLSVDDMTKKRESFEFNGSWARGMPQYFSSDGKTLWVYPAPDNDYELILK